MLGFNGGLIGKERQTSFLGGAAGLWFPQENALARAGQRWPLPSPLLSEVVLWLDAADSQTISLSGTSVTSWASKGAFSNTWTQGTSSSRPDYSATGFSGLPAITFSSSTRQWLGRSGSMGTIVNNWSAFVVASPSLTATSKTESSSGTGATTGVRALLFADNFGATDSAGGMSLGTNVVQTFEHGNSYAPVLAQGTHAAPAGAIYEMSLSNRSHSIRKNGTLLRTGLTSPRPNVYLSFAGLGDTQGWGAYAGALAEVIAIAGALTTTVRQEIEGYLAVKWGLTGNLPTGHPYRT